jgi:plastocyanin
MKSVSIFVAVLALAVAGCGGSSNKNAGSNSSGSSSSSSGGGGGQQLALSAPADGSLKFDKTTLSAKAGKVTINFDNPSSNPHGVDIEGSGVDASSDTVTKAKTSVTADLKPGKYTFFCPVAGHRQAGMEGTLTVQ